MQHSRDTDKKLVSQAIKIVTEALKEGHPLYLFTEYAYLLRENFRLQNELDRIKLQEQQFPTVPVKYSHYQESCIPDTVRRHSVIQNSASKTLWAPHPLKFCQCKICQAMINPSEKQYKLKATSPDIKRIMKNKYNTLAVCRGNVLGELLYIGHNRIKIWNKKLSPRIIGATIRLHHHKVPYVEIFIPLHNLQFIELQIPKTVLRYAGKETSCSSNDVKFIPATGSSKLRSADTKSTDMTHYLFNSLGMNNNDILSLSSKRRPNNFLLSNDSLLQTSKACHLCCKCKCKCEPCMSHQLEDLDCEALNCQRHGNPQWRYSGQYHRKLSVPEESIHINHLQRRYNRRASDTPLYNELDDHHKRFWMSSDSRDSAVSLHSHREACPHSFSTEYFQFPN